MIGVSLSRWSMSYFAAALMALLAAEWMMAVGYGYPAADLRAPETLVLVHVVAIGWLSLLMCGALFQFLPVLVNRPLASNTLPLPALACLLTGLAALILGFLQLGGQIDPALPALPVAGTLLGAGFSWSSGISSAPFLPRQIVPCPRGSSSWACGALQRP